MQIEGPQTIPSQADLEQDDRLALMIGKLVQTCSFMEYWVEMNTLTRVATHNQKYIKLTLIRAHFASKLDTLQALLAQSQSSERMEEWAALRTRIKATFDQRNAVAHGVFGQRMNDNAYMLHSLKTGDSGSPVKVSEYGIEKMEEVLANALGVQNNIIQFLAGQPR